MAYLFCHLAILLIGKPRPSDLRNVSPGRGVSSCDYPHVVTSVMIALACFCFCLFGLRTGLNIGPANGLTMGLDYGLRIGLSYWLLLGLYQGITQEHLKDQDRPYFNEGIHRSLFNGIFLGLLGAAIIVGISFLTSAIGSELSYTLYIAMYHASAEVSYTWDLGLGDFWLCGLSAWFVLWLATGGLTILRHYTLRLLLARSHTFPLRAQRFWMMPAPASY